MSHLSNKSSHFNQLETRISHQSVIRICQAFQNAPEIVCEPQQMIISML